MSICDLGKLVEWRICINAGFFFQRYENWPSRDVQGKVLIGGKLPGSLENLRYSRVIN